MKKFVAILLCLVMVLAIVACGKKTEAPKTDAPKADDGAKKLKVVNLVNGNLGDKSFFDSAESGMVALKNAGLVDYKTIEMGTDESTWQNYVEEVSASKEFDIIVCGTSQMPAYVGEVAAKYPDQMYVFYDDEVKVNDAYLPNVANVTYKQNEMSYLVGVYAALMETKSNLEGLNPEKVVGFVGGIDIPIINDFLVGFIEGVQSVDPEVKVDFRWIGSFTDTAQGKEIGAAMIKDGVDIVWGVAGTAGTAAVEACYEAGVYFIGVDSDQEQTLDAKYGAITLTSGLKNVGASLEYVIKKYLDGDKSPWGGTTSLGLAEGGVGIVTRDDSNFGKQSQEIKDAIAGVQAKVLAGEVKVDSAFDPTFDLAGLKESAKAGK